MTNPSRPVAVAIGALLCALLIAGAGPAQAAPETAPAVRAVLFYSPTCPHCHKVIRETLEPMTRQYGERLRILAINVKGRQGRELYQAAIQALRIPEDRVGVPTLIVGETVLVGDDEIPARLPGMVRALLAAGGSPWPDLPGLREVVSKARQQVPQAARSTAPGAPPGTWEAPLEAGTPPLPSGAVLAWAVLLGMSLSLLGALWWLLPRLSCLTGRSPPAPSAWPISLLALAGLGVSAYLAYVEVGHVAAVCGPVGDCNAVQASPYARIAGVPVAVLGVANYLLVLVLYGAWRARRGAPASQALIALTVVGVGFSIYLTAVEIFVIHAVCLWCLSSAVIATLLMLLVMWSATREPRGTPA